MNENPDPKNMDEFIERLRASQKNLIWPDYLSGGRRVDEVLFKVSSTAPLIHRIVGWVFGFLIACGGVGLLFLSSRSFLAVFLSLGTALIGVYVFWVACKSGRNELPSNSGSKPISLTTQVESGFGSNLVRASGNTEEALQKVGPKPLIQRLVGWILGFFIMLGGVAVFFGKDLGILKVLFAVFLVGFGGRIFWVACKSGSARKL